MEEFKSGRVEDEVMGLASCHDPSAPARKRRALPVGMTEGFVGRQDAEIEEGFLGPLGMTGELDGGWEGRRRS